MAFAQGADGGTSDAGTSAESQVLLESDGSVKVELSDADRSAEGDIQTVVNEPEDPDVQEVEQADASRVNNCLQKAEEDPAFCDKAIKVCTSGRDVTNCSANWDVFREDAPAAPAGKTGPRAAVAVRPVPMKVPDVVIQTMKECIDNSACTDLYWLKENTGDAYRRIRLWCDNTRYKAARRQKSIATVCKAIDDYHGANGQEDVDRRWRLERAEARGTAAQDAAIAARNNLDKALTDASASNTALQQARTEYDNAKKSKADKRHVLADALKFYASASPDFLPSAQAAAKTALKNYISAARDTAKKREQYLKSTGETPTVRSARVELRRTTAEFRAASKELDDARSADEEGAKQLKSVDRYKLIRFQDAVNGPIYSCGGWGLILPLFSARKPDAAPWDVNGPVAAGVGGGYYLDISCDANSSWGFNLFGYSEGLDPGKKLHFAVGASVSLTAFKYFGFGVGLGYDLFRHTPATADAPARTTGLFPDGYRQDNVSLLFTFSLKSESETNEAASGSVDNQAGAEAPASPKP